MMNLNNFTVFSADKGGCLVTITELFTRFTGHLFNLFLTVNRLCIHCNKRIHLVTSVDIQNLCDRT